MEELLKQIAELNSYDSADYQWLIDQHRATVEVENLWNGINAANLAAEARDRANNPHMTSFYNAIEQARADGINKALRF